MPWDLHRFDRSLLEPDTGGNAGGSGDASPPVTPAPPAPAEDLIPKREAQKAFKDRDRAKATSRLLAAAMGLDPDEIEIVETGDKDKPYELKAPGLQEVQVSLDEGRKNKRTRWEDRERELGEKHQRQVERLTQQHTATVGAREAWIREQAAINPIRIACAAEKAFDPLSDDAAKAGQYEDIIALLSPRVRVQTQADDEGKLAVMAVPLNEDGTVMLDSAGKPASIRQLVAEFLNKRPHFRQNRFHSGPGAGGLSPGQATGVSTTGRPSARDLVGRAFGVGA